MVQLYTPGDAAILSTTNPTWTSLGLNSDLPVDFHGRQLITHCDGKQEIKISG
jgi:hypothetical protein